ncbi:MAG: glycoside hydrolase family 9 protein [Oscillospiraceae bacterium]|nr:glycoside hydrolase family 9 protein [Oscillospiraceae bacterium]
MQNIVLDQVGFLPGMQKSVIFRGECRDDEFEVVNALDDMAVFTGKIGEAKFDPYSGENVRCGDFSAVTKAGCYYIRTLSCGRSYSFTIAQDVYNDLVSDMVRMMYLQRCGTALDDKHAGIYAHIPCHTEKAYLYGTDVGKDVSGGWHDAGDYGRYTVAAALTAAEMMLAYEAFPNLFSDETNIPESGNGIPDILDEVRYGLDWLFKMQDISGGVYHKVTCAGFPGFVMPEEERDRLILCPLSKTATGSFAAVMAMASDCFKGIDGEYAQRCLSAAEKAWDFLMSGSGELITHNPEGIFTGAYENSSCINETYWAAAQLYKATGTPQYREVFDSIAAEKVLTGFGWENVGDLGNIAYLSLDDNLADPAISAKIRSEIIGSAEWRISVADSGGYSVATDNYCWGSNSQIAGSGMHLMLAYSLTHDRKYYNYASEQLAYILGKNPLDICFVTGYGTNSPCRPHHRPSIAKGAAVKGMLVGGANRNMQDELISSRFQNSPPSLCYADHHESYSTNENDTYWNTLVVLLIAELMKNG